MSDLKKEWKKTAKSLVNAANDLGEAIVDSAKVGREKVVAWANTPDDAGEPINVDATEIPDEESPADNSDATV